MIVRNEAHIIAEALDSVAPYIHSWVIVDTGSTDGTQDLIREHMAGLGIPGEIHERPWRNFGHNRSEALELARGHGDYIWVMDADDLLVGTPDFTGLTAGLYYLRLRQSGSFVYWRGMLFRDGLPWFYKGVVHEYPWCDEPHDNANLEGDYHIESRRIGARNLDERKYARDRDLLLAEVENTPGDARSVFYLAQSYRDLGDLPNARRWYARRAGMAGFDQETHVAQYQLAQAMLDAEPQLVQVAASQADRLTRTFQEIVPPLRYEAMRNAWETTTRGDSAPALSQQMPVAPIERSNPCRAQAWAMSWLVYWASSIGRCNTGLLKRA